MTNLDAIEALANLSTKSEFASSLVSQFRRKGNLSDKQWLWVHCLVSEHPKPQMKLDVTGIVSLFATASDPGVGTRALKRPKLHLRDAMGQAVVIYVRRDGNLGVSDGRYPGRWFGLIYTDSGTLSQGRDCTNAVIDLLRDFAANPIGMAIAHGRLTGHCCFCGLPLKDARSVEKGYGPVCAANWGLSWGKVSS